MGTVFLRECRLCIGQFSSSHGRIVKILDTCMLME